MMGATMYDMSHPYCTALHCPGDESSATTTTARGEGGGGDGTSSNINIEVCYLDFCYALHVYVMMMLRYCSALSTTLSSSSSFAVLSNYRSITLTTLPTYLPL